MQSLPAPYQTFRHYQLPPIARELYTEISRLSKIPIVRLTPMNLHPTRENQYEVKAHTVAFQKGVNESFLRHELIHSVLFLANDMHMRESMGELPTLGFIEPIAQIFHPPSRRITDDYYSEIQFPNEHPVKFDEKLSKAQFRVHSKRISLVSNFYLRRGPQAFLLLMTRPITEIMALQSWEERMIRGALLPKKAWGITKKGHEALRRVFSKERLARRLKSIEMVREMEDTGTKYIKGPA
ncbi:MAG: hypothetical protein V1835_06625 [Candidatus Micrarchaeota archaeon]